MQRLDYLQRRLIHPAQRMLQQRQHLEQLQQRLQHAQAYAAQNHQWRWQALRQRWQAACPDVGGHQMRQAAYAQRLRELMMNDLERHALHLKSLQQHLQHLDPRQVLRRGYSMVRDAQGRIIVDSAQIATGSRLQLTFAQGWATAEVQEKGGD
jgi:exodeoxyribonuclease VII large subunit